MKLALDPRALRLLRRLPRSFPYAVAEIVLIALLAIQCARIVWVAFAPAGPLGDWKAAQGVSLAADPALLSRFDPFFRLANAGATVVTSLSLKLFGVRVDQAMGRGSAIIATPDGVQASFAVGDEIVPGVRLTAVAFDNVTIDRGGAAEQLFLDQSVAAPVVQPFPLGGQAPPATPSTTVSAPSLAGGISFVPRVEQGAVSGFVVSPKGDGGAFRAIGLQPGDIVTSINGQGFQSVEEAGQALATAPADGIATFNVERAGRVIVLRATVAR